MAQQPYGADGVLQFHSIWHDNQLRAIGCKFYKYCLGRQSNTNSIEINKGNLALSL